MNGVSRRKAMRSVSALVALPFTQGLLAPSASGEAELTGGRHDERTSAVSLDLVSFVKDYSARAIGASHEGRISDYASLGDQFHLLGRHLSLAGADRVVKARCKQLLKAGTVPTIDPKAMAHAISSIRAYAPSYSIKELMSASALPSSPQEWAVQLKKLKKNGLVAYCHRAGRQLKAMGRSSGSQVGGRGTGATSGTFKTAGYDSGDPTHAAHLEYICSLSQKEKFFLCIGATLAAGLLVLAAVVAICGATGLVACIAAAFPSGSVGVAVVIAGFGLITGALLAACAVFLASYHPKDGLPLATLSTI